MTEIDVCPCGRPDHQELIRQLREALGMFAGAMACTPKQAFEEALDYARRLAGTGPYDDRGKKTW